MSVEPIACSCGPRNLAHPASCPLRERIAGLRARIAELEGELGMANDCLGTVREALGEDDGPFIDDCIRSIKAERDGLRAEVERLRATVERLTEGDVCGTVATQHEELERLRPVVEAARGVQARHEPIDGTHCGCLMCGKLRDLDRARQEEPKEIDLMKALKEDLAARQEEQDSG